MSTSYSSSPTPLFLLLFFFLPGCLSQLNDLSNTQLHYFIHQFSPCTFKIHVGCVSISWLVFVVVVACFVLCVCFCFVFFFWLCVWVCVCVCVCVWVCVCVCWGGSCWIIIFITFESHWSRPLYNKTNLLNTTH